MQETMNEYSGLVLAYLPSDKEKEVQIFPHARVDGDCVGTAVALASSLRKLGYRAQVILDWQIPPRLSFMNVPDDLITVVTDDNEQEIRSRQGLAFAVDCSEGQALCNLTCYDPEEYECLNNGTLCKSQGSGATHTNCGGTCCDNSKATCLNDRTCCPNERLNTAGEEASCCASGTTVVN